MRLDEYDKSAVKLAEEAYGKVLKFHHNREITAPKPKAPDGCAPRSSLNRSCSAYSCSGFGAESVASHGDSLSLCFAGVTSRELRFLRSSINAELMPMGVNHVENADRPSNV